MSTGLKLDLNKAAAGLKLNLAKKGIATPPQADVAFLLDVSGSFEDEHRDGSTNLLLSRLVPWAMVFDPDGKIDAFTFSNGPSRAHYVGEMNVENHDGFVRRQVIDCVPGWNGGTDYSYVIEKALVHYGWMPAPDGVVSAPKKSGFFGRLFGSKPTPETSAASIPVKRRSLINLITDGDNSDPDRTMQVLQASQQRSDEVYFNFIAYSNGGSQFRFLQRVADAFQNTGLVKITNLRTFCDRDDDAINNDLIGQELVDWLKK